MRKDIGIVFAFGPDDLALQARSLVRSINRYTNFEEVLAFTTPEEYDDIDPEIKSEMAEHCTLEIVEKPIDGYPIAIKEAALQRAASMLDTEYLLCLDVDMLLLDEPNFPERDGDLFVKPVDIGTQYYGTEQSFGEWEEIASQFGFSFPGVKTRSTVDKHPIPPYWNGGMVLTRNNDFPDKWVSLTEKLYEQCDIGYFTEQVSLALLSTEYSVVELGEMYNYPLTHRVFVPNSTAILHYNTFQHLARVYDPRVLHRVLNTGLFEGIQLNKKTLKTAVYNFGRTGLRRLNHILS